MPKRSAGESVAPWLEPESKPKQKQEVKQEPVKEEPVKEEEIELEVRVPEVNPEACDKGAEHGEVAVTHKLFKVMLLEPTLTTLI